MISGRQSSSGGRRVRTRAAPSYLSRHRNRPVTSRGQSARVVDKEAAMSVPDKNAARDDGFSF